MSATRDPEATKARIFAAATAEFAGFGIAGARIDRIAKAAKANKQLIYAYFGDKQQLFEQVLERAVQEVAAAVSIDIEDLDAWLDGHLDYLRDHPEFLRLTLWEALEIGPESETAAEYRVARYAAKSGKIADAQRRGLIRADLPPEQVLILLLSLVTYPNAVPQVLRFAVGPDWSPDRQRSVIKDAARRMLAPK
ncbi:TetR family transcriptional regulator [Nocardia stercoris]|uniref:TetR/AcrR family transcriptional regulator n=1 Tax=Nocardia stercoris TaxID=2483361 RepID=A0A3M2LAR6_9NOCA|nr:TetR family transcriptional regulator [Nocardia stercoris]RMI31698.1 TetR/AcrR family transcriptional regulator [Nocardia stercoris]